MLMRLRVLFLVCLVGCEQITNLNPNKPDTQAPGEVTGLLAEGGDAMLVLTWKDPPDPDFTRVHARVNNTDLFADKGTQTLTVRSLVNGTPYPIVLWTSDTAGNRSPGVSLTGTPVAATYLVTFQSNGGSSVAPVAGVLKESLVEFPTPPTKTGLAFAGWFTDAGLSTAWRFDEDKVAADLTLHARWGSVDAVGAWFDLQDDGQMAGTSDDTEVIWVFEASGRYLKYGRPHGAGSAWTSRSGGATISRDGFLTIEEGQYYLDGSTAKLHRTPRDINVVALGLLNGSVTDTADFGFKSETEATKLLAGTARAGYVTGWYHPDPDSTSFATIGLSGWDDLVPRFNLGNDVLVKSPLSNLLTDSKEDFRFPATKDDYPALVQSHFPVTPTNPLGVVAADIVAAWTAYASSPFLLGLPATHTVLTAAATAEFSGGATTINQNGTTGSVNWTNVETNIYRGPGGYDYSGTATFRPATNQTVGAITLLTTTQGSVVYAGNEVGQTSNLGTWTLKFSGTEVETLVYQWNDKTKSYVGNWLINGTISHVPIAP